MLLQLTGISEVFLFLTPELLIAFFLENWKAYYGRGTLTRDWGLGEELVKSE